jgi:hypothetical protein
MKLKLKQEKLQEMLEKLLMQDMFPSSIIRTKDGKLFSIQREEHGRAYRFVEFNKNFFDEIDDEEDIIELDVEKTLNLIKDLPANQMLIFEKVVDKISIKRMIVDDKGNVKEKGHTMKSYKEPEGKLLEKLPFDFKDGTPILGTQRLALDTIFTIDLGDLKTITKKGSTLKTDTYKFSYDNNEIVVRVGDLHAFSDYDVDRPQGKILNGTDLSAMFTYGIPQVANTFREKDVRFNTRTSSPIWITEKTDTYTLGVFIPPYTEP